MSFRKFMAALSLVRAASSKCLMLHTTGNRIAPQQTKSTSMNMSREVSRRKLPTSLSSIIISATFANTYEETSFYYDIMSLKPSYIM